MKRSGRRGFLKMLGLAPAAMAVPDVERADTELPAPPADMLPPAPPNAPAPEPVRLSHIKSFMTYV
jgi:hypothetical protein